MRSPRWCRFCCRGCDDAGRAARRGACRATICGDQLGAWEARSTSRRKRSLCQHRSGACRQCSRGQRMCRVLGVGQHPRVGVGRPDRRGGAGTVVLRQVQRHQHHVGAGVAERVQQGTQDRCGGGAADKLHVRSALQQGSQRDRRAGSWSTSITPGGTGVGGSLGGAPAPRPDELDRERQERHDDDQTDHRQQVLVDAGHGAAE
jgi:hypothetical protein